MSSPDQSNTAAAEPPATGQPKQDEPQATGEAAAHQARIEEEAAKLSQSRFEAIALKAKAKGKGVDTAGGPTV